MTFQEAINTGYKVQCSAWLALHGGKDWWAKKNSNVSFITHFDNKYPLNAFWHNSQENVWIIHPEDQKFIDFNNKLGKIVE